MRKLIIFIAVLLLVVALGATAVLARTSETAAPAAAAQPAAALVVAAAAAPAQQNLAAPLVFVQEPEPEVVPDTPAWGQGMMQRHMGGARMMGSLWGDESAHTIIAAALGLTAEELTAAVQDGATIASLAAERGVDLANINAAVLSAHQARLQAQVEAGAITAEQAAQMQARMAERWTLHLEQGGGFGGYGRGAGDGTGPNPDCPLQDGSGNPGLGQGGGMHGRGMGRGMHGQGFQGAGNGPTG